MSDDGHKHDAFSIGYYIFLVVSLVVMYYTYRLDRLVVEVKVQSDQRRHTEKERFIGDFEPGPT